MSASVSAPESYAKPCCWERDLARRILEAKRREKLWFEVWAWSCWVEKLVAVVEEGWSTSR
jgi:hypothetical protein